MVVFYAGDGEVSESIPGLKKSQGRLLKCSTADKIRDSGTSACVRVPVWFAAKEQHQSWKPERWDKLKTGKQRSVCQQLN